VKGEPVLVAVLGVGAVDDGFTPKVPEYQFNVFQIRQMLLIELI
jgi:hypothetical protein